MPSRFYLVSGFHRSGTSLLAQTLAANGMHMGDDLMGASFSNPLGHVEDMPIVRLHDKIYEFNGCDWRYHDSSSLIKPNWLSNYITTYVNNAYQGPSALIGVKDPRAVHFLKDWQSACGDNIRFVLIFRDWRLAAYSLLKRHSRHLLNNAHPLQANTLNLSFWQQTDLAFKMWLSANRRILEFYEEYADSCLLISQEALVNGSLNDKTLNGKIGLGINAFQLNEYRQELLSSAAPELIYSHINPDLFEQLESCLSSLNGLADYPSATYKPTNIAMLPDHVKARLDKAPRSNNIFKPFSFNVQNLTWAELSGAIVRIPKESVSYQDYLGIIVGLGVHIEQLDALSKIAHMQGLWLITKLLKMKAMQLHAKQGLHDPWELAHWSLYCEQSSHEQTQAASQQLSSQTLLNIPQAMDDSSVQAWFAQDDAMLANVNPFSLRNTTQLPDCYQNPELLKNAKHNFAHLFKTIPDSSVLESVLSIKLLIAAFSYEQYLFVAKHAGKIGLTHIEYFCLFKAYRLSPCKDIIVDIADMLFRQSSFIESTQLYEYAFHKGMKHAPLLARCAISRAELGHMDFAQHWLLLAQARNAKHPKCKEAARVLQRAQVASSLSETNQSTLRHRFAVLPQFKHYDEVLSNIEQTPQYAAELERYNLRASYLNKSNQSWLNLGLESVDDTGKQGLTDLLEQHWEKIFGPNLHQFMFNGKAPPRIQTLNAATNNKALTSQTDKFLVSVDIKDIDSFAVFVDFLNVTHVAISAGLRWSFILSTKHYLVHQSAFDTAFAEFGEYHIQFKPTEQRQAISQWVAPEAARYKAYGVIHTYCQPNERSRQALIQSWYAMFGFEFGLRRMVKKLVNDNCCLILPSYPAQSLHDAQQYPLFYPLSKMAWLNKTSLSKITELSNRRATQTTAFEVMPDNTDEAFKAFIKPLLNALKHSDLKIEFSHQLLDSNI